MTCASSSPRPSRTAGRAGSPCSCPDYTAETFEGGTGGGGSTGADGRQGSFREWTWDPDPADDWIRVEYEFTLRAADGTVQIVREAHRLGAFRRDTWLRLLADAGFEPEARFAGESHGRERRSGDARTPVHRVASALRRGGPGPRRIHSKRRRGRDHGLDNSNRRRGGTTSS